jgi:hypothetical protein
MTNENIFEYRDAEYAKQIAEKLIEVMEEIPGTEAFKYAPEEKKREILAASNKEAK